MNNLELRVNLLKDKLTNSFDIIYRHVVINDRSTYVIFLSSLSNSLLLSDLIESIVITNRDRDMVYYPGGVEYLDNIEDAIVNLLSGQSLVMVEKDIGYYVIETRSYPSRSTSEPNNEQSVKGAHDGFVENIILNVGLLRRRIRDESLYINILRVGKKTRTDIAIAYLTDVVNPKVLNEFNSKLNLAINSNAEIISERYLVEAMYGRSFNPYTHVRYTERPDIASVSLLQGYIIVIVDNSPNVIILPTSLFEQLQQIEEYTQTNIVSLFTKLIRFIGILFRLYLLPLWIVLVFTQNPTLMDIPYPNNLNVYEFGFQLIFADIIIEWIRMSLIHTPSILSGIMSFIVVFILGAYTKEILIMIALVNIGNLLTPNYELALANKLFRVIISFFALLFGLPGFCFGVILHLKVLLSTSSKEYPYLYPWIPFSYKEFKKRLLGIKY
ncbi:MAG: spore germination protein [Erysipelotrichaceae bacterium]